MIKERTQNWMWGELTRQSGYSSAVDKSGLEQRSSYSVSVCVGLSCLGKTCSLPAALNVYLWDPSYWQTVYVRITDPVQAGAEIPRCCNSTDLIERHTSLYITGRDTNDRPRNLVREWKVLERDLHYGIWCIIQQNKLTSGKYLLWQVWCLSVSAVHYAFLEF